MTPYTSTSLPYVNMLSCYSFIRISLTSGTNFLRVFLENRYKVDVIPQLQPSHNSYPPQHASLYECTWKWNYKKKEKKKHGKNLYYFYALKNQKFYQNVGTDLVPNKISQRRVLSASTFWAFLVNRRCVSYSLRISSLSIAGWVRA